MKNNFKFLAALISFFAFISLPTITAQVNREPNIVKKVDYAKKRDAKLETALNKWSKNSKDFRYHYNFVDLNDDGQLDAVVFISGDEYCGTGGCEILIFKGGGKEFSLLTELAVSRPPIWVSVNKTKGWRDLVLLNSGGGIKSYYSILKFDGKSYPDNPTVEPALPKRNRAKFTEYLSGIDLYDTGFEIK